MTVRRADLEAVLGHQILRVGSVTERQAQPVRGVPCYDLTLTFSDGTTTKAWWNRPDHRAPTILYCHAHGLNYAIGRDELLLGRPALKGPYGPDLAAAGFGAFALDLPCFGSRSDQDEATLAHDGLAKGAPLMGRMLAELRAAFAMVRAHAQTGPIATLGLSMGATHAFWLAALEPQVAACAHIAAFADFETLTALGQAHLHAPYMTVPGLFQIARTGQIAGCVAPRPQLVCVGAQDPLTPPPALAVALNDLRQAYRAAPDAVQVVADPDLGHAETDAFRKTVLDFLRTTLR